MRQLVLDTETTGLFAENDDRVVEVGIVELVNRRATGATFHRYVNPGRPVGDSEKIHGIKDEFLADKPSFSSFANELWDWIGGDELIIHNASFDIGFLDKEFKDAQVGRPLREACAVTDTVQMARKLHPGQKASLDALCKRYNVDNSNRDYHGALLDARLLADVYLAMTGGQSTMALDAPPPRGADGKQMSWAQRLGLKDEPQLVLFADPGERAAHVERLKGIAKKSRLVWGDDLPPG